MSDNFDFGALIKELRYVVGFIKDAFALLDEYAAKRREKLEANQNSNE